MDFLPDVGLDFLPSVDVGLPSVDVGDVGGAITGAGYAGELGLNIFDAVSDANSATADGVTNAADIAKKAVVPVSWYTQHVDDWNRLLRVYGDDGALEYATDGQGNGGNGVRSEDGRLLQSGRFSNPFARRHVRNGTSTAGAYGGGERGAVAPGLLEFGGRTKFGIEDTQYRPHVVEIYRSAELQGSNIEDFVCSRSNFTDPSRVEYPHPMLFAPFRKDPEVYTPMLWRASTYPKSFGFSVDFYSRIMRYLNREALERYHRTRREKLLRNSSGGHASIHNIIPGVGRTLFGTAQYLGEKAFMSLPSTARKALGSILSKTAFSGRDLFDIPPTQPDSRAARDVRIALLRQKQKALRHYLKQRPNLYYRGKSSKTMRKGFRIPHGWSAVGSGSGFRFETPKMGTNLLTQSPTQELLKSVNLPQDMAANPKHPWLKFDGRETAMDRFYAKPRPYVRVTLEDKSAGQVLWDAVFNMRNQRQPQLEASSTVGKVRALFTGGGRFSLGSGGDDPNFLREDATPIHGVQKKMVKICPRTTDLVPRLYTLYVRRWPQINEREDFIGRMLFQSYMTTDPLIEPVQSLPPPNAMRLDYADANTYKTFVADADKKARKNSGKMLEQFFGRFMHDLENYIMKKVM
eukprot:g3079.t1